MHRTRLLLSVAVAALPLAGCVGPSDEALTEGVTLGAGNAIAHNSALQIIDPWPAGVQNTKLKVPAERDKPSTAATTAVAPTL